MDTTDKDRFYRLIEQDGEPTVAFTGDYTDAERCEICKRERELATALVIRAGNARLRGEATRHRCRLCNNETDREQGAACAQCVRDAHELDRLARGAFSLATCTFAPRP